MHAGNDDSVLNLKRELRDHLTAASNNNAADGEDGSTPTATTASTSEQVRTFL